MATLDEDKELYVQAALLCGEAFQRLAAGFIPRIGKIKEESAQAMSNELGDLVACATNLAFALVYRLSNPHPLRRPPHSC